MAAIVQLGPSLVPRLSPTKSLGTRLNWGVAHTTKNKDEASYKSTPNWHLTDKIKSSPLQLTLKPKVHTNLIVWYTNCNGEV